MAKKDERYRGRLTHRARPPTNTSNQFKALGTHTGGHLPRFRTDLYAIARTGILVM